MKFFHNSCIHFCISEIYIPFRNLFLFFLFIFWTWRIDYIRQIPSKKNQRSVYYLFIQFQSGIYRAADFSAQIEIFAQKFIIYYWNVYPFWYQLSKVFQCKDLLWRKKRDLMIRILTYIWSHVATQEFFFQIFARHSRKWHQFRFP